MRMRTCVAMMVLLTLTASASFAQKIYWADISANTVHRGDMDGIGAPELLFDNPTDGILTSTGIFVDVSAGKVYWGECGGTIRRGNVDGTGAPEDLFGPADGVGCVQTLTLDVAAGKIYWSETIPPKVLRGNMDGTGSPEVLFDGSDGQMLECGNARSVAGEQPHERCTT